MVWPAQLCPIQPYPASHNRPTAAKSAAVAKWRCAPDYLVLACLLVAHSPHNNGLLARHSLRTVDGAHSSAVMSERCFDRLKRHVLVVLHVLSRGACVCIAYPFALVAPSCSVEHAAATMHRGKSGAEHRCRPWLAKLKCCLDRRWPVISYWPLGPLLSVVRVRKLVHGTWHQQGVMASKSNSSHEPWQAALRMVCVLLYQGTSAASSLAHPWMHERGLCMCASVCALGYL